MRTIEELKQSAFDTQSVLLAPAFSSELNTHRQLTYLKILSVAGDALMFSKGVKNASPLRRIIFSVVCCFAVLLFGSTTFGQSTKLAGIKCDLKTRELATKFTTPVKPIDGTSWMITNGFGNVVTNVDIPLPAGNWQHTGVDYVLGGQTRRSEKRTIYSAANGVVVFSTKTSSNINPLPKRGGLVIIKHAVDQNSHYRVEEYKKTFFAGSNFTISYPAFDTNEVYTYYLHLDPATISVGQGDFVLYDQPIAQTYSYADYPAKYSYKPHLHFELWKTCASTERNGYDTANKEFQEGVNALLLNPIAFPQYVTVNSASRAVVSTGLRISQNGLQPNSFELGKPLTGTFSVTNRGTGNLFMKRVVIGGRLAGTCPNNQCPDFGPVPGNITLAPGQSYNYAGTFTPSLAGNYTFSVAYENSDGKWTMPVEAENNNVNRLNITVQSLVSRVVVSRSLTITPGPIPIGQTVRGSFSITNRGNTSVVMRQVLIGGRLANTCPNDVCPDFSPISPNITLGPGQTFNYSGQISLTRAGSYTFYVAYQTPDQKWEMPVRPENGTINTLSLLVQGPTPTLTGANPSAIGVSTTAQSITLSGTRLAKVIYAELRLPNGSITYLYIPLNQLFRVNDDQTRINARFLSRGTYYVTVWTAEGRSNRYPIVVN